MDKHLHNYRISLPSSRFIGPCGLHSCRLNPCTLTSHRSYVRTTSANTARPASTEVTQDIKDPRLLPSAYLIERSAQHIEGQLTDGLPALPFETPYNHQFRGLIHYYVTDQVLRLGRIFAPHLDPQARTRTILEMIYSNPILSVCVIGNSQTDRVMRARSFTADHNTQVVYGVTLRVLRERIESFQPSDVQWLLLLVVVLSGLGFCLNESLEGMKAHRAAIAKLVAVQGGIHKLGFTLSYVQNTDRFLALCLGEYPLYSVSVQTMRPTRPIGAYGRAFEGLTNVVDLPVIDFSEDECRLINMLESAEVDLTVSSGPYPSKFMGADVLPYFLYLRDNISSKHADLHAYYHDNQVIHTDSSTAARASSISRCVLLAGHIVFYLVCFGDYYTVIRPMLGSELEHILRRKPRADWRGHEGIVIWLLFVLATIPKWSGHEWAIAELRLWLSMRNGESWPQVGWVDAELPKLRGFVWCDHDYNHEYSIICEEVLNLERGLQALHNGNVSDSTSNGNGATRGEIDRTSHNMSKNMDNGGEDADDEAST